MNCCSISEAVTCWLKGFFLPNCYFSSAYRWWVNFSSVFSSLSKDRQRSVPEKPVWKGLWRIKWIKVLYKDAVNVLPKPGNGKRCWWTADAGNIIVLCNFSPIGVHSFAHFEAACHLLAFLTPLNHNSIGNVHQLWSLWLLFLIVSSICWFVCCVF